MKVSGTLLGLVFTLSMAGCTTSLTCQPETCANGKSYQACAGVLGAQYNFGSMSCSCSATNTGQCQACSAELATYCGGNVNIGLDMATAGGASSDMAGGGGTNCSLVGTFTNTTASGAQVTMVQTGTPNAGNSTLTIVTSTQTITIMADYAADNDTVTIINTASSPASVQGCIGEAAKYSMTWSATCSTVTLHKTSDQCQGRIADADGALLTRS